MNGRNRSDQCVGRRRPWQIDLTHCGPVIPCGIIDVSKHWRLHFFLEPTYVIILWSGEGATTSG